MLFAGLSCTEVSVMELAAGDFVEYELRGRRTRRVRAVHIGRVNRWVTLEPPAFLTRDKGQKIPLSKVLKVWRPL